MFGLLPQLFGFPLFLGDDPCIQRSFQSDRLVVSQEDKKKSRFVLLAGALPLLFLATC